MPRKFDGDVQPSLHPDLITEEPENSIDLNLAVGSQPKSDPVDESAKSRRSRAYSRGPVRRNSRLMNARYVLHLFVLYGLSRLK